MEEKKDVNILLFREELKDLYVNLIRLEKENPELYTEIIEEIREKIADVKHRMALYLTEKRGGR